MKRGPACSGPKISAAARRSAAAPARSPRRRPDRRPHLEHHAAALRLAEPRRQLERLDHCRDARQPAALDDRVDAEVEEGRQRHQVEVVLLGQLDHHVEVGLGVGQASEVRVAGGAEADAGDHREQRAAPPPVVDQLLGDRLGRLERFDQQQRAGRLGGGRGLAPVAARAPFLLGGFDQLFDLGPRAVADRAERRQDPAQPQRLLARALGDQRLQVRQRAVELGDPGRVVAAVGGAEGLEVEQAGQVGVVEAGEAGVDDLHRRVPLAGEREQVGQFEVDPERLLRVLGQLGGLLQVRDRRRVADHHLEAAEPAQQLGPVGPRLLQAPGAGRRRRCRGRRARRRWPRPARASPGRRRPRPGSQSSRWAATASASAPCRFSSGGGAGVQVGAAGGGDLLVDRGPHQRVDEAVAEAGGEDRGGGEPVDDPRGALAVGLDQRRQRPQVGGVAEDGGGADDVGAERVEAGGAFGDAGGDPLRAHRGDLVDRGRGVPLLGGELDQQLLDQERVAAGRLVAGGLDLAAGGVAEALADDRRGAGLAQRRRPHGRDLELGGEPAQQLGLDAGLVRPRRQREQDRQPVESLAEVADEAQRGAVAPVRVVDRQHQRSALDQAGEHPEEPVERALGGADLERAAAEAEDRRGQPGRPGEELRPVLADRASAAAARTAGGRGRKPKSRSISEPRARSTR